MSQLGKGISNAERDHFCVEVGMRIRELRRERDISCQVIAAKTGLTLSTVTHAEDGRGLSLLAATLIARAIGVSVSDLVPASALERPWQ